MIKLDKPYPPCAQYHELHWTLRTSEQDVIDIAHGRTVYYYEYKDKSRTYFIDTEKGKP